MAASKEQDIVFTLLSNVLVIEYGHLPAQAVLAAKRSILEPLGPHLREAPEKVLTWYTS